MKKLLWVKFGWSEFYRGGVVDGNFSYLEGGKQGHEAWNFHPAPDGRYYCYTQPQGKFASVPSHDDPEGWTVVCLAVKPGQTGVHVVGWYENARLAGKYTRRPDTADLVDNENESVGYTISAKKVYIVPPQSRTEPFSHVSIGSGRYSFLKGPGIKEEHNKIETYNILTRLLDSFHDRAILNPTQSNLPDLDNDENDPLAGLGTPQHRKMVEEAAVNYVTSELENRQEGKKYRVISREAENIGYDLDAINDDEHLRIEVKGTSQNTQQFFLTINERLFIERGSGWRLALVTSVLSDKPQLEYFNKVEFERKFDLTPLSWKATLK